MGSTVAVIGGGITGLSTAYRLSTTRPDLRVILFEAGDRFGGQISTERIDGGWVERGADSFLARDPYAVDLCRDLGLEGKLRQPAVFGAYLWTRDRLRKMPPNFWGIPTDLKKAVASGVISPATASRAATERKARQLLTGRDVSIGKFIAKRFGRQILHRMVDPILAGTRAGSPRELSLAAALPEVDELARREPSLLRALAGRKPEVPPFYSLEGGLETLIDALRHALSAVSLQPHTPVSEIHIQETAYSLRFERRDPVRVDGVVVALPPPQAAPLMAPIDPEITKMLKDIAYARAAIVTFLFPAGSLSLPEDGSGILVPQPDMRVLAACTWWSQKWPGSTSRDVLRCFVGRTGPESLLDDFDDRIAGHVLADLGRMLEIPRPQEGEIVRWDPALPILGVGHLDRVTSLQQRVGSHPGLALAGVPERGSGITECIRRGMAAADRAASAVREGAR